MPRYHAKEAQVVRCLALLVAMARARRGVRLRALYERRGWSWRAAYRDVDALRAAGVPVAHEHGWYRVAEGWMPPGIVDVRRDELAALHIVRLLAPGLRATALGRALDTLWAKMATPGHQVPLALGDETWLDAHPGGVIDYAPHQPTLDAVHAAIRERRALKIHYRTPDGTETQRIIEPVFVRWEPAATALYVRAWCRLRGALRTFAIHRILAAKLTAELFAPRREAISEMSKAYRLWARPSTQRVALRFAARVAGEIRERCWHATQQLTEEPDGGVVLSLEIAAPEELERWLLGFGADVEVLEPQDLAACLAARHAEAAGRLRLGMLPARPAARGDARSARRRTRSED